MFTKRGITDTIVLDEQKLMENFSLTPSGVIEYKALAGDGSDNIPGIPGVGEKTALSLLEKYKLKKNLKIVLLQNWLKVIMCLVNFCFL